MKTGFALINVLTNPWLANVDWSTWYGVAKFDYEGTLPTPPVGVMLDWTVGSPPDPSIVTAIANYRKWSRFVFARDTARAFVGVKCRDRSDVLVAIDGLMEHANDEGKYGHLAVISAGLLAGHNTATSHVAVDLLNFGIDCMNAESQD